MEPEMLIHLLSNVGVPAAICFYTLFALNKNVQNLTDSINKFSEHFTKRVEQMEQKLNDLTVEVKIIRKGSDSK